MVQERDKQINVRIYEETRDEWHDHVDKNREYGSMSELVRIAVNEKISKDENDHNPWDIFGELIEDMQDIKEMHKTTNRLIEEGFNEQVTTMEIDQKIEQLREIKESDHFETVDEIDFNEEL
jgi:hypothetical protein